MAMNKEKASGIIVLVIICCVFMALIETIIEPAYIVKSALKVAVFLLLPLVYAKITHTKLLDEFFKIDKRGMMKLFVLGSFIYAVILGAYTLTKNFFDYASLVQSLSADQKVNSGSFIGVALYISFCNSLYYRVVVIRAPLQGLCYTVRDAVDWFQPPTTRWFQKGSNHSPLQFC